MAQTEKPQQSEFDALIRRALATPPINNEEIERRSKERKRA
jgi:hypothetical protein